MSGPTPRERFQAALSGEPVDRPPVWFMRQAGRSLPEYRKVRRDHGFIEVCTTPELAREVSLQPVDRFGMDAAVVFSDILLPLRELGFEVRYESGVGPVIDDPLRDPEAVDALPSLDPNGEPAQTRAIRAIREDRPELGVVGFAGAPFTLACYLIEGGSPKRYEHVDRFRHEYPDAFARLLDRLAEAVAPLLEAHAGAGADAVQVFDTHAEHLAREAYEEGPLASAEACLEAVPDATGTVLFAKGTAHLLEALAGVDCDALSLDWRVGLDEAADVTDHVLQGNLDPSLLVGPPDRARQAATRVLDEGRAAEGHVFNLGHGVTPSARLETIQAVVDAVREAGS